MKFSIDHFIERFEAIPEDQWTIHTQMDQQGKKCAFGHMNPTPNKGDYIPGHDYSEYRAFSKLSEELGLMINRGYGLASINNYTSEKFPQETPKQRVIAALQEYKKLQDA